MTKYYKKINVLAALIAILLIASLLTGCPARRPAPQEEAQPPETIVVPEVSRIFFSEVELEEGPQLARQLVANNQGGEMAVWFEQDEEIWVLIQSDEKDEILEIEEVLQRVPARDTMLLEIRLSETEIEEMDDEAQRQEEEQTNANQPTTGDNVTLIKLDLNQRPHGIAFLFDSRLEAALEENNGEAQQQPTAQGTQKQQRQEAQQPQQQQPKAPQQQQENQQRTDQQEQQNFIQVQEPSPNQEITSPVQIVGRAKVNGGNIGVRLKNANGEVIAESTTTATAAAPEVGNFSATLSYSPPNGNSKGTLEVYSGQNNLVAVPVVIK